MYKSFIIFLTYYFMLAESEIAPPYSTPWSVSIAINNNPGISENSQHLCSGSIISQNYIVTLAKCINKIPNGSRIEIIAPSDDGFGTTINVPKQTRLVNSIFDRFINTKFNDNVPDDEIVVVILSHPLNFSNFIQKASYFVEFPKIPEGTVVYFHGWTEILANEFVFNGMTTEKRTIINDSCEANSTITTTITGECNNNEGQLGGSLVQSKYGISRLVGMWISNTCSGDFHYATYVCMQSVFVS